LIGVFAVTFFTLCLELTFWIFTLKVEFERGVRGFVELVRKDIVDVEDGWSGVEELFGGVGGLPVEGLRGVLSGVGLAFSRGFRNILLSCR